MMRPADGISYYTGMRYIEELYRKSKMDMKQFSNQAFEYGNIPLKTLENILGLSAEKKAQEGIQTLVLEKRRRISQGPQQSSRMKCAAGFERTCN